MKIMAGIVTYNPNILRLQRNINSISNQVDTVLIVDNNSKNVDEILYLVKNMNKIHFIKLDDNYGIAVALNKILDYSCKNKYDWFLTLDQDTIVKKDIIEEYLKYIDYPDVAIINSNYNDDNLKNSKLEKCINDNVPDYQNVDCCITSASFNNTTILKKIGGYDNSMFIDMVDFDICATVVENNYKIIKLNKVLYNHEIGKSETINIFGKRIILYNENPIRVYYFTRNNLYYIKKHKKGLNEYFFLIRKCLLIIVFEKNRIKKIRMMIKALKDSNHFCKCLKDNK